AERAAAVDPTEEHHLLTFVMTAQRPAAVRTALFEQSRHRGTLYQVPLLAAARHDAIRSRRSSCALRGRIGLLQPAVRGPMRFLHTSDIHLLDLRGATPWSFLNKRITGGINLALRRGRQHD